MAKKNKIPKKIAGVKIPKLFRKNKLLKGLLGSPTGRALVADALMAAATAAAGVLMASKSKVAAKAGKDAADTVTSNADLLKDAMKSAAAAMTQVIANAAKSALPEVETERPRLRQQTH